MSASTDSAISYFSEAACAGLHRRLAVDEWRKLGRPGEISLERALAAFDLFVLEDGNGDLDEVSEELRITLRCRSCSPWS